MELSLPGSGSFLNSLFGSDITDNTGDQTMIPNADEDKLTKAIASMERGDIEYVILNDGSKFMQAAADGNDYILEYNDGSEREQYRAKNKKLTDAEITNAFVAYLNRDPAWQTQFTWEKFRL